MDSQSYIPGESLDSFYNRLVSIHTSIKNEEQTKLAKLRHEIAVLQMQKLSFEKRKQYLEDNMPDDKTMSAWCADLTEDLTGEVGTVEVPGESTNIQIQPGHESNAVYNQARDGQLLPTAVSTPAQTFYNLAMMPGWQKWKPLFRYGTITAIDGDTASVTLENIKSSQQALEINQASMLTDVDIEYMDCNGSAFEEGDDVLLKFTGQAWDSPVVVGFKEDPKPCEFKFVIKPTFNCFHPSKGGQCITIEYNSGTTKRAQSFKIYGSLNEPPDTTISGYSDVVTIPPGEADDFISTAIFKLKSKTPGRYGTIPYPATFSAFKIISGPQTIQEESGFLDESYLYANVGTGDGTTSPAIYQFRPDNGFSLYQSNRITFTTVDINDESMTAGFDYCGFHVYGQNSESRFNVTTGSFDVSLIWDNAVKMGAEITARFYEQALGDGYYGTGNYYNPPDNRVWVKEVEFKLSENSWSDTTKTNVVINDETITVLNLEYLGLKIVKRTPTFENAEYPACVSGLCGTSILWNAHISNEIYGSFSSKNRYFIGENISIDGRETTYNTNYDIPGEDWNYQCMSKHKMAWSDDFVDGIFIGILTDDNGNNPAYTESVISVDDWYEYMYVSDDPANMIASCEGPDSFGDLPGAPCSVRNWEWTYSMIDTPADAF